MTIGNIYCVGRNYRLHALELGNEVPTAPMIFTKPTHALRNMDGSELVIPYNRGAVHFELELVLRIGEGYVSGMPVEQAIDGFTLGLDLTLRDVQSELKAKGHPWLAAKGFKGSATIGQWLPLTASAAEALMQGQGEFKLLRNGELAQLGHPKDMIFSIEHLIQFIDEHYGLGAGDLIYTGTPAGVVALNNGDRLQLLWNEQELGSCTIVY